MDEEFEDDEGFTQILSQLAAKDKLLTDVKDAISPSRCSSTLKTTPSTTISVKDVARSSEFKPEVSNVVLHPDSLGHVKGELPVPDAFPFPFSPYSIQSDFMRHLYETLDGGEIGIFESPTGTGKSLSLICGALLWLKDFEGRRKARVTEQVISLQSSLSSLDADQGSDWIASHEARFDLQRRLDLWRDAQAADERLRTRLDALDKRKNLDEDGARPRKRRKVDRSHIDREFDALYPDGPIQEKVDVEDSHGDNDTEEEDDEFLVDVAALTCKNDAVEVEEEEKKSEAPVKKIYFCSRTHSQLSQFVGEVRKSPHGDDVRLVALASRQNLCVNDTVKKLGSVTLINERCQELRDAKTAKNGCPYFKREAIELLSEQALTTVSDIEDLASLGRQTRACPYYASRSAIPLAEVVVMPYNLLLHKSTRQACGIDLKDQIVIIDEAHNLIDAISSVHGTEVTLSHVQLAHAQLTYYLNKYKSRLKPENVLAIRQIVFILLCLKQALTKEQSTPIRILTPFDFLYLSGLDHQVTSIPRLLRYMTDSQICRKLQGFADKYSPADLRNAERIAAEKVNGSRCGVAQFLNRFKKETKSSPMPEPELDVPTTWKMKSPLMLVRGFLETLLVDNADGRVVLKTPDRGGAEKESRDAEEEPSVRFLLLNPAEAFADVVSSVRSLVLAGGTMEPVDEVVDRLFLPNGVPKERIHRFSCGHVVPKENLLPMTVGKGPSGTEMAFTFKNRLDPKVITELGQLLLNFSRMAPGGVVVFFPSYDYERLVYSSWTDSGLLKLLEQRKRVFREPKVSSRVDAVLGEYAKAVEGGKNNNEDGAKCHGGILFSVVGGKMSEGINFSDDLGRLVIMVGLPYPNKFSPELREKMTFLDNTLPRTSSGVSAGQEHYENLCMKAVNQSVGRAIRHRNDFAAIAFVDARSSNPNVVAKLPAWIRDKLEIKSDFSRAYASLKAFYDSKK